MIIQKHQLDAYVGKSIAQICPNGFAALDRNHCAHFVAHALGYDFGRHYSGKTIGLYYGLLPEK